MALIVFVGFIATVILAYKTMKHDTAAVSLGCSVVSMAFRQGQPQRRNKCGNAN